MATTVIKAIGGLQAVWLGKLASGPHTSGLSAEDRRCLESLLRRGLVAHPRGYLWEITVAGLDAYYNAPRLSYRIRYSR